MTSADESLILNGVGVVGRLDAVTAKLNRGSVVAICGPNGAGKSTALACLAGLIAPDFGMLSLGAQQVAELSPVQRAQAIGYLPQAADVAWDLSVEALVSLGRLPWRGAPAHEAQSAIDSALEAMELEPLRHRPISRLSGGERARALMARVLATRPEWILADEPLAALDLSHARTLMRRFQDQAQEGRGVVLVLHDLATAMNYADRVLVLEKGRLVADGPPAQALSEAIIQQVWGVDGQWLGSNGARALAVS